MEQRQREVKKSDHWLVVYDDDDSCRDMEQAMDQFTYGVVVDGEFAMQRWLESTLG